MSLRISSLTSALVLSLSMASASWGQALHILHEGAGVPCAACHQEEPETAPPPAAVCIACHGTMIGDDAPLMSPDPHRSPHLGPDEVPVCTECHKIHSESEVTCVTCHRGFQFDLE